MKNLEDAFWELTEADFNEVVLNASAPVFVEFWASWCQPCVIFARMLMSILSEMEDVLKDKGVILAKFEISASEKRAHIARELGVMGVPQLLLFNQGTVIDRTGMLPPGQMKKKIIKMLDSL